MKPNVVYHDFRPQTRLEAYSRPSAEQLQARDHQRRMPPSEKAWFVVSAMELIAWCVFTAYVVWRVAVFGRPM